MHFVQFWKKCQWMPQKLGMQSHLYNRTTISRCTHERHLTCTLTNWVCILWLLIKPFGRCSFKSIFFNETISHTKITISLLSQKGKWALLNIILQLNAYFIRHKYFKQVQADFFLISLNHYQAFRKHSWEYFFIIML